MGKRRHEREHLGAAPGGWSQYAAQLLRGRGRIIATDILDMEPLPGVASFIRRCHTASLRLAVATSADKGAVRDLSLLD